MNKEIWPSFGIYPTWMFDVFFYNISKVPFDLWKDCTIKNSPEDSIIVLTRTKDSSALYGRTFKMKCYETIDDMNSSIENNNAIKEIQAVALTGVGSSALGAVALAIDIADALGSTTNQEVKVAAIVTGEGSKDVFQEGLGGWYGLGTANEIRQRLLGILDWDKLWLDRIFGIPTQVTESYDPFEKLVAKTSLDLTESKLIETFITDADRMRLVVGHSKGCLYLNNALCKIFDAGKGPDLVKNIEEKDMKIVTLGTVVQPPRELDNFIHQFRGEIDMLGIINSRRRVKFTVIPGVQHHLNTRIPMHLDCYKVLTSEKLV